jgi:hypothetical protein
VPHAHACRFGEEEMAQPEKAWRGGNRALVGIRNTRAACSTSEGHGAAGAHNHLQDPRRVSRACPRRAQPIRAGAALQMRKSSQHSGRGTCPAPLKIRLNLQLRVPDSTRSMSSRCGETSTILRILPGQVEHAVMQSCTSMPPASGSSREKRRGGKSRFARLKQRRNSEQNISGYLPIYVSWSISYPSPPNPRLPPPPNCPVFPMYQ